jgi:hypothetical protein
VLQAIAKNALTMLINLSSDEEVLKLLAQDEFVEDLLVKLIVSNSICMLSMQPES